MSVWVLAVMLAGAGGAPAAPPPAVQIAFSGGRVSVAVADAPVADVLAAWARVGHAELTGADHLGARRITINLANTAEADALLAIVGAPDWYTVVVRESPALSESVFGRIAILPAAAKAAAASDALPPEQRYSYYSDPRVEATIMAQLAQAPPRGPSRRPPDVEPEAFYQYAPTLQPSEAVLQATAVNRQPLHPIPAADPEVVYTYAPTKELPEPVVTSPLKPAPPDRDPEQRFVYAPTTPLPGYSEGTANRRRADVPALPVVDGFDGLTRLPGRTVRYVSAR